ncbi:MAG: adenylosuccinate lyase [Burkholderia sp.]|nr:adenylosuccinate lyase [Burkholderia sp.]
MSEIELNTLFSLRAISPLDGRYARKTEALRDWLSEFAFMRHRVTVEIHWLIALSRSGLSGIPRFSNNAEKFLLDLVLHFSPKDAMRIKNIECITNHDVKAVEYWLKESVKDLFEFKKASVFIHFACTSEDINNTSYGMMIKGVRENVIIPALHAVHRRLIEVSHMFAYQSMLSRTHGQSASPTTLGKEIANVAARLSRAIDRIEKVEILGKMNGAVGNFNAHMSAYPEFDWEMFSRDVIEDRLKLTFNPYTTQIEPHDYIAELFHSLARTNTILVDFNRDLWSYISIGYFKQKIKASEVGSSTMPHKINPIDFENSEGNLGLANAILNHLADKLPVSRLQRDLTDSTVLRNIGSAFGYALLAYNSLIIGLDKLEVNPYRLNNDLDNSWEVMAEPVQTVMRCYGIDNSYEQLKELTRGKGITRSTLQQFIIELEIPKDAKDRLLSMTPASYIGKAAELAKRIK